jgi:hypothetical protein
VKKDEQRTPALNSKRPLKHQESNTTAGKYMKPQCEAPYHIPTPPDTHT